MTSRSIVSRSSRAGLLVVGVALIAVLAGARTAEAGKRVVVLRFEGPKAEKFRSDVEAAVKKGNTVVSLGKWTSKASALKASKPTPRNVKKVAAKLKVDGVIVGTIEKRGPRYYVHLRMREGVSGAYVANVEIVVRQGKLGSDGNKVIKSELLPAIKELSTNRGGADEDEEAEDEPVAKASKGKNAATEDEDDDEARGVATKKKSGFGRKGRDEEAVATDEDEEDEAPVAKKTKGKKKAEPVKKAKPAARADEDEEGVEEEKIDENGEETRVAASDEDSENAEVAGELRGTARDQGEAAPVARDARFRPLEVGLGMSATARRFNFDAAGSSDVQGYRGDPVAGVAVTADLFPLAFNRRNRSITANFGLTLMFDRVIKISSRLDYQDMNGVDQSATLGTTEQRYAVGLVYRQPIGDALELLASVRYNRMTFEIDKAAAPAGVTVEIPNVDYTFIDPGLALRYLLSSRIIAGAGASVGFVTDTGEIKEPDQLGTASVLALEGGAMVSVAITSSIDVRADLRVTTIGFSFQGDGDISNPDMDASIDVPSARDTYYGATALAAYHF